VTQQRVSGDITNLRNKYHYTHVRYNNSRDGQVQRVRVLISKFLSTRGAFLCGLYGRFDAGLTKDVATNCWSYLDSPSDYLQKLYLVTISAFPTNCQDKFLAKHGPITGPQATCGPRAFSVLTECMLQQVIAIRINITSVTKNGQL